MSQPSPKLDQEGPPAGWSWRSVGDAGSLADGGDGRRFQLLGAGPKPLPGFVIRHQGRVHAYLNRCAHLPVELDWQPGRFFDDAGLYLVCATHGAVYDPASGLCMGGPCRGQRLTALDCIERDGWLWILMKDEAP